MAKQLIVVVHGVGVKEAGVSIDWLSALIESTPEEIYGLLRKKTTPDKHFWPHSSDDFILREFEKYSVRGKRKIFSARVRRYRQPVPTAQDNAVNERVVADFYWSDIAMVGAGVRPGAGPDRSVGHGPRSRLTMFVDITHFVGQQALGGTREPPITSG